MVGTRTLSAVGAVVLFALALLGCGQPDYRYKGTEVWLHDGVAIWPDYDAAIDHFATVVDSDVLSATIRLVLHDPCGIPADEAAGCYQGGVITVVVRECEAMASALPHEFAHRWQDFNGVDLWDQDVWHDQAFEEMRRALTGDWRATDASWPPC